MGLSNNTTPIYYAEFRKQVMRGDIPVNNEISLEMNRIDRLIKNPNYYYDPWPTEAFIRYSESEMTLTDGGELKLLPSFKLWAEQIFGWYYYERGTVPEPDPENHGIRYVTKEIKKRLTVKQYLIVARGSAKSLYETLLQSYFLTMDKDTTHQITTSPTMKQAEEVMAPFRTAITRSPGKMFRFMTAGSLQNTTGNRFQRQKLAATKKGIENFLTSSLLEVRPMTINKLQGLRPKVSTVDEWLSGDLREDVIGAIEQGATKLPDYLIVAVSSEGTVRNGSGDSVKMELAKILKGEYNAPHISIWHYKLDSVEEVADPRMWVKANPNIGITVSYEAYARDVERAENAPENLNDILAKRFGIPREGHSYFFTYEETLPVTRRLNFEGLPCAMGADLSRGDDFCAFTFIFPLGREQFGVKTISYISELTMNKLPGATHRKYQEFFKEGTLRIMNGSVLDMLEVYDDLDDYITRNQYDVLALGYDPYNAKEFVERWTKENGDHAIEKVIQGVRSESVPLGEIKKLVGSKLMFFDQQIMQYTMGHAITLVDTNGGRKLWKQRADEKIDNVAALMDAWVALKANKEEFE